MLKNLLELFEPLFGFKVSCKSIEKLYSDEEVKITLHNLFILLLRKEGVSGEFAGDGTGYLDRYNSSRKVLIMFGKETAIFVIPKRNLSRTGFDWLRVIERIVKAPYEFLKRYFKGS